MRERLREKGSLNHAGFQDVLKETAVVGEEIDPRESHQYNAASRWSAHLHQSDMLAWRGSVLVNIYFHTDALIELLLVGLQEKCQSHFGLWESYRASFRANTDIWNIKNSEYWPI